MAIFQVNPDYNVLHQMLNKQLLTETESRRINLIGKTFKKLNLSNQKRIFTGFDIC